MAGNRTQIDLEVLEDLFGREEDFVSGKKFSATLIGFRRPFYTKRFGCDPKVPDSKDLCLLPAEITGEAAGIRCGGYDPDRSWRGNPLSGGLGKQPTFARDSVGGLPSPGFSKQAGEPWPPSYL